MSKEAVEEAIQAAKDAKDRAKAEKAYNDASTTPPAPKSAPVEKKAKGGYVKAADGIATKGKTKCKMY